MYICVILDFKVPKCLSKEVWHSDLQTVSVWPMHYWSQACIQNINSFLNHSTHCSSVHIKQVTDVLQWQILSQLIAIYWK